MNLITILIVILVLVCLLGLPGVSGGLGWHHNYGYYPSGIGGIILLIIVLYLFFGRG